MSRAASGRRALRPSRRLEPRRVVPAWRRDARFGAVERALARVLLVVFVATGAAGPAGADPTQTALGPAETTHGSGEFTINTPTHTEYTQHTPQAVVDWGVDIQQGADHTLGFRQDTGFSVLNRSPGVRASNFYGTVECDATCIFANEAGIYFHDGSFVDVGQLIAAGGTIQPDDFLAGQYLFQDVLGEVVNRGTMRGDAISLLGQRVANFGQVETPGGSFAMLAGNGILLRDLDSPIVIRSPLPPARPEGSGFDDTPAVENAGTIDATDGEVRLAAGDMLSFAIRQSGEIRARRIALEGGQDGLVEVSGVLDASDVRPDAVGGDIDVLGDYVSIVDEARLDASGATGGGRVRVGGDRRGEGDTPTARGTFVGRDTQIRADAVEAGDGGEVVVFAEDTAQVYGTISARGGTRSGDGGFVETSGKRWIDVRRAPEVHARSGRAEDRGGEWLIDPNNIEIVASPAQCGSRPECLDEGLSDANLDNPVFGDTGPVLRPTVDDSKITADVIAHALESGSNVSILTQTASTVPGEQVGDITVSAEIVAREALAPGPGTNVALSLFAAQNLTVNEDIRVERRPTTDPTQPRGPSDLTLDLALVAADPNQVQAQAPQGSIPNSYLGKLAIRGDLDTAGGDVQLRGYGIELDAPNVIATNGGFIQAQSSLGDLVLRGRLDTTTDVRDEATDTLLSGGFVDLRSIALRRPDTGASDSPTTPVGTRLEILNHIETGGGDVDITAQGGNLVIGGASAATIASGGGNVILRAVEETLAPVTSSDVEETVGGRIQIEDNGRILSDQGLVDVGVTDIASTLLPGAREIVLSGEIDTRALDPSAPFDPDLPTASLTFDESERGAAVFFSTAGEGAAVRILPGASGSPAIRTNGSRFDSIGDGTFRLEDGTIDTRFAQSVAPRPTGVEVDSNIQIEHDGRVEILESVGATTGVFAEESLVIRSGVAEGVGDLIFEEAPGFLGDPELMADFVDLSAGDGEAPNGMGTDAEVLLGNAVIRGFTNASPEAFSLQQDADLDANAAVDNLPAGLAGLERLRLAAWDGVIDISDPALLTRDGLDLSLDAGTGVVVPETFAAPTGTLDLLAVSIVDRFVLDQRLAAWLSGAARDLRVGAGALDTSDTPSLTIQGSTGAQPPMELFASDSLTLQGGQQGTGDLAFTGQTELGAPDITLRAGNGDFQGTAEVLSEGLAGVTFSDGAGANPARFTLRQDAAITPDSLPDVARFVEGDVDGVQYTLRADATGSGITLDTTSPARVQDSALRLYANGPIDLSALADDSLVVRGLDIGGIASFQYTAEQYAKLSFTSGAVRDLVIRAGLGLAGVLSFEGGLEIEADEIRLVAGDGVGGNGTSNDGSRIDLSPTTGAAPIFRKGVGTGPDRFVFRQDADIVQSSLPDLTTNFEGHEPGALAIRSDDGSITLDDFASGPVLVAGSKVVLSAPEINLDRTDGEDLVIDSVFGDGSGGTPGAIEMRGDVVVWNATDSTSSPFAEVVPGTTVKLTAFDTPPDDERLQSPPAPFDFDAVTDAAPGVLAVIQDGDIGASNLIDLAQLGTGAAPAAPNDYVLTSLLGKIEVRPGDVAGSDLVLLLDGTDEPNGAGSRTVDFLDDANVGFDLASLVVQTPFGWTIGNASTTQTDLTIRATDFMDLLAGLSNPTATGTGNLDFAGNVTLRSAAIVLQAGDDPGRPETGAAPPDDPHAVVDVTNATFVLDDQGDPDTETILRIFQHGTMTDSATADPTMGSSRLVQASQIVDPLGQPVTLDELQLSAILSDFEIQDFGNGTDVLPARSVTLVAGSGLQSGGTLRLMRRDGGDLNLSVDENGNEVFDALRLFGRTIELVAVPSDGNTTDQSVVRAAGTNLVLLGPLVVADGSGGVSFTSPDALRVEQNAGFLEAEDPIDCSLGCLPNPLQLGPTTSSGLDYDLVSRAGQVYVNEPLTLKVWGSNLTLEGNNVPSPLQPDVLFDIQTARSLDLFLSSLTVGGSGAAQPSILLRGDPVGDAFGDLTLVTAAAQTYDGSVAIDGNVELTGDVVEFSSGVDENQSSIVLKAVDSSVTPSVPVTQSVAASGLSDLVVGVVTEGRFDGDVGAAAALDRLRLNFDPTSAETSRVRFGSATGGGPTTVNADTIEFFAVSDAANDIKVARTPLVATIYKKNGDLTFDTSSFTMGVGEKLTVQGNLAIDLAPGSIPVPQATLGDLSAVAIRVGRAQPGDPTPTIALQRRQPGQYLARDGTVRTDNGVDYVANTIDLDGQIVLTGVGAKPVFGIADPRTAPVYANGLPVLAAQASGLPLTPASISFGFSDLVPDLHPEGASRDDITEMYFADDLVPRPPAWDPDTWLPWQQSALTNLFVFARPLDRREYATRLAGASLIDDVGRNLQAWDGRPVPIAAARLDGAEARRAVELFEEIFGADGGNVHMLRRILQRAVDEYVRNTGARRVVGFELRRYVKNRPSSLFQAHQLLDRLDTLFAYHRGLGLTPGEYRPIQARWLAAIRPEGITTAELAEAVQPSRYVRGTDVLDIFGD